MTTLLWIGAIFSLFICFLFLRAKFALKNTHDDIVSFKNDNEYLEVERKSAPDFVKKYIDKYESEILAANYVKLCDFVMPKKSMKNYHVIYTGNSSEISVEIMYLKMNVTQRILMAFCGSSLAFNPETFCITLETNYTNGEVLITGTLLPFTFPKWVHATFLDKDVMFGEIMSTHLLKKAELEEKNKLEAKKIITFEDLKAKEKSQRERMSNIMLEDFDKFVQENDVEWLVKNDAEKNREKGE